METPYKNTRSVRNLLAVAPQSETTNPWLNGIPAIAQYTSCSRRTCQNWISAGDLPVKRLSKRHLLAKRKDVDELIDRLDREFRERTSDESEIYMEEVV